MEPQEYYRLATIENHHWWYRSIHSLILSRINRLLPQKTRQLILDVGCGTGGLTKRLHKQHHTIGCDVSELALKLALPHRLRLVQASINQLPFAPNSFDLVVCVTVLGQTGVKDKTAAKELIRVVKPGGYIINIASAFQSLSSHHDKAVHLLRRYNTTSITNLFGTKVQIVENHYIFSLLFPIFLFKRLSERVLPFSTTISDLALPPKPINTFLHQLCSWEWKLSPMALPPFGSSIMTILRKP